MKSFIIFIGFLCFKANMVKSETEDDMKAEFVRHAMKCHKEHPVDMKELFKLQRYIVPTNPEVNCLLACAYKRVKILTAQGTFNLDQANVVAEKVKNGDENRLANAKKIIEICKKVNDEPVTDGKKGCDRAALLFKCAVENVPKYGFKL